MGIFAEALLVLDLFIWLKVIVCALDIYREHLFRDYREYFGEEAEMELRQRIMERA